MHLAAVKQSEEQPRGGDTRGPGEEEGSLGTALLGAAVWTSGEMLFILSSPQGMRFKRCPGLLTAPESPIFHSGSWPPQHLLKLPSVGPFKLSLFRFSSFFFSYCS